MTLRALVPLALVAFASACSSGADDGAATTTPPYQELAGGPVAKYVGKTVVASTSQPEAGVTTYTMDAASGPKCLRGDSYQFSVRDTGSDDLFLFLQGGGACWSTFCLAVETAPAGIPKLDILDRAKATNPLRDTSLVYLPYCDGSMFAGDADHDDDGDGKIGGKTDRQQRGLANLTAALNVAAKQFPHPKRVVLAGSSGGGYGTILATILVRFYYPDAPMLVFDDSGAGLGKPGDEAFIDGVLDEFAVRPWLPKSCAACTANGHITRLVAWELAQDPALAIGLFSSYQDAVISDIFLGLAPGAFQQALVDATGETHAAYPDRYRRFFVDGAVHTSLLGNVTGLVGSDFGSVTVPPADVSKLASIKIGDMDAIAIDGVSVSQWFGEMLSGSPSWDDRLQAP